MRVVTLGSRRLGTHAESNPKTTSCGLYIFHSATTWLASEVTGATCTRPILLPAFSVNQTAPSDPPTILKGTLAEVGIGYSAMSPSIVRQPILFALYSVNQM